MKILLSIVGIASLLVSTTHAADLDVPEFSGRNPTEHPILSPCTRYDDRYTDLVFPEKHIKEWPEIYHEQVDKVVEEYFDPAEVECDAENYNALLKPGEELEKLAKSLPIWKDGTVPLGKLDTARVLLEYLRIYECSLKEFADFLYFDTRQEEFENRGDFEITPFFFSDLMEESLERSEIIKKEREIARKALHRTLLLIGAFDRLRPLEAELMCMQELSLDIRNAAALSAEASACMPRIWNAKDVLRDLQE